MPKTGPRVPGIAVEPLNHAVLHEAVIEDVDVAADVGVHAVAR